jgi:hypothetical protein
MSYNHKSASKKKAPPDKSAPKPHEVEMDIHTALQPNIHLQSGKSLTHWTTKAYKIMNKGLDKEKPKEFHEDYKSLPFKPASQPFETQDLF